MDSDADYPKVVTQIKKNSALWRGSRLWRAKYLNNILEQDHRNVERRTPPGLGFGGFRTSPRALAG
jgi:transposase-like protein